ncbi:MAG: hypothetical protein V2G48_02775 [bacterium JZ-2024 1]
MKYNYQRWMLKTALFYLIVGVLLGLLIFLSPYYETLSWASAWKSTHVHLILVGTVIQTIMGVALWMFPRKKEPPHFTTEREGTILYVVLNAGVIVRSIGEPFHHLSRAFFRLAMWGMVFQILAMIYFAFLIYGRIRPPTAVSPR